MISGSFASAATHRLLNSADLGLVFGGSQECQEEVGNSLMIPLPPETISESGFQEGMEVAIDSRPGHVDLDPAGVPDQSLVEFAARFTQRYREDLAELADL